MPATVVLAALCLLISGCDSCRQAHAPRADGAVARQATGALRQAVLGTARQPLAAADHPSAPEVAAQGTRPAGGDCVVVADANPDYGAPPLAVSLSAEAECSAGEPQYTWDFGDGSPRSSEANPTHTYGKAGEYLATVTVKGPDGATGSDEVDVTLEAAAIAEP